MWGNVRPLWRRPLSAPRRFALLSFFCILAITALVCGAAGLFLRHELVSQDGAVIGDLASRLFTSSVAAGFFAAPPGADPAGADRLREFARSGQVVRFMVYDAAGRILWSDDPLLIGRRSSGSPEVTAALRGATLAKIIRPGKEDHHSTLQGFARLEEVYTPVRYQSNGPIVGVIELYRAPSTLFAALDRGVVTVWVLGGTAGLVLYLTLVTVVRNCFRNQIRLEAELARYSMVLEARVDERTRQLAQKAQHLSTLYAMSSTLGRSLETQEILGRALDELADGKGFGAGWIQLLSDENGGTSLVVRRGISEEIVQRFASRGDEVARSGRACVVASEATPDGLPGLVVAPLGGVDQPLGALAVAGPAGHRFTADDTQLLSAVGRQIGVAIGNARLYAATREREREARILYETTARFGELTDGDALLTAIVEGAVILTGASYGGAGFPDGDEMVMHRLVAAEPGPAVIRLKITGSLAGLTFLSGVPHVTNDAVRDPRVNRASAQALGIRSLACVPLQCRGRVMGVLFVGNKESASFTEQDVIRLRAFAHHAAAALENARLRAETLKREREASILYRTSTRLHAQTTVDALLTTIVEGAIEITEATCGGIGRLSGDVIVLKPVVGLPRAEICLPVQGSAAGLTYETGEPLIVNDLDHSPCEPGVREAARAYGLESFLCAPLRSNEATLGVIKVGNKKGGRPFTADDLRMLTTFATHAAMTLDNARLLHEMKTTKEYLENLIASSVDAIITFDPRGRVTLVSQGGRRMFGYKDDEVTGRSAHAFWARGAQDYRAFRTRLTRCGRVQNHETELKSAGGGRLAVNISASFLRGAAGEVTGILAVVKDVTSLRRLHEQMVRSERLAAAGLLAAGVAHEVGNPLTCISSLAQVLMAHTSDDAIRRGLEDIEVHVGRISRIVQDLTRLTRPAPATVREASIHDLVDTAVTLARHNPVVRRMSVDRAGDPALPTVRVAPDHIVQVFLNLILNAADAGGNLAIRTVGTRDTVRVIFQDSGYGMTAEETRRLFDPFHSTKDNEAHLGLGLFVSHEIVRQHGGELLVESQPGVGSTLTVVLPAESSLLVSGELS